VRADQNYLGIPLERQTLLNDIVEVVSDNEQTNIGWRSGFVERLNEARLVDLKAKMDFYRAGDDELSRTLDDLYENYTDAPLLPCHLHVTNLFDVNFSKKLKVFEANQGLPDIESRVEHESFGHAFCRLHYRATKFDPTYRSFMLSELDDAERIRVATSRWYTKAIHARRLCLSRDLELRYAEERKQTMSSAQKKLYGWKRDYDDKLSIELETMAILVTEVLLPMAASASNEDREQHNKIVQDIYTRHYGYSLCCSHSQCCLLAVYVFVGSCLTDERELVSYYLESASRLRTEVCVICEWMVLRD
jgi:hypothetical protein